MTTTVPSITPLPSSVPQTTDPTDFDTRADAFLTALPTFGTEMDALIAALNAVSGEVNANAITASAAALAATATTGYLATSTTTLSVAVGSKAFTTQSGKSFAASGDRVSAISRSNPAVRMRGSATYSSTTLTITVDEIQGSGTFSDWLLILTAMEPDFSAGRHAMWVPAGAMTLRLTNGAAPALTETTTNKVIRRTLDFDPSTIQYAQFSLRMPKSWDEGNITFVPAWLHGSTSTNFAVSWGLQAVAISDGDATDAAFGTAQYSNDVGGTTDTLYVGPECAAITIAGSPAAQDLVAFQVLRKADDVTNDTLAVNGRLLGYTIYFNTNAGTDL